MKANYIDLRFQPIQTNGYTDIGSIPLTRMIKTRGLELALASLFFSSEEQQKAVNSFTRPFLHLKGHFVFQNQTETLKSFLIFF